MSLLASSRLWLLLVCVTLAVAYALLQRRSRHKAVRHTDLALVASIAPRFPGWRRHLTAAALLLTLCALVVGLARPARSMQVPRDDAVVMLAVDLSASMNAADVRPTRLQAAVAAAKKYVAGAPSAYRIGLVGFDARPHTLASPSTDRQSLLATLDALKRRALKHGTATGEALYTSLAVMKATTGAPAVTASRKPYRAVILLTDGASQGGRSLTGAARAAARQKVPVFTIGYGTPTGVVHENGKTIAVPADPQALTAVAKITGGIDYTATSGDQLADVYDRVGTRIGHVTKQVEYTVAFAALAAALLAASLITATVWSPRLV